MKKIMLSVTVLMSIVTPAYAGVGDWVRETLFPVQVIVREVEKIVIVPDLNWLPSTPTGIYQLIGVVLMILICGKIFGVKIPKKAPKEVPKEETTK